MAINSCLLWRPDKCRVGYLDFQMKASLFLDIEDLLIRLPLGPGVGEGVESDVFQ